MSRNLLRLFAFVAMVSVVASASTADAGLFAKLFGCKKNTCCPPPTCCEPEPVCCEPEPVCCEPEPVCHQPVTSDCGCSSQVVSSSPCGGEVVHASSSDCGCGSASYSSSMPTEGTIIHSSEGQPTPADNGSTETSPADGGDQNASSDEQPRKAPNPPQDIQPATAVEPATAEAPAAAATADTDQEVDGIAGFSDETATSNDPGGVGPDVGKQDITGADNN